MPKRLPGRAARIDGSVIVIGITSENLKAKTAAAQTAPILPLVQFQTLAPPLPHPSPVFCGPYVRGLSDMLRSVSK